MNTHTPSCAAPVPVAVAKSAFLKAIATAQAVAADKRRGIDGAGEVITPFRQRSGADVGQGIDCPRRPHSRLARYFLMPASAEPRTEE